MLWRRVFLSKNLEDKSYLLSDTCVFGFCFIYLLFYSKETTIRKLFLLPSSGNLHKHEIWSAGPIRWSQSLFLSETHVFIKREKKRRGKSQFHV